MKIGQAMCKAPIQTNYAFQYSAAVHFDQNAAAAQRHKHQTVFCLFWYSQAELLQQQKFIRFLCLAPSTSFTSTFFPPSTAPPSDHPHATQSHLQLTSRFPVTLT